MGQNRKKIRKNSHLITDFPTSEGMSEVSEQMSECSGARKQSEQCRASERVSSASERVNGRASGPVLLQSVFLAVIDHSGRVKIRGVLLVDTR